MTAPSDNPPRPWTIVHFTIPTRFYAEEHPLGATPGDWFDVVVRSPAGADEHAVETLARLTVNQELGDHVWTTTYLDGPGWDEIRAKHYPGRCVATITIEP